MLVFASSSGQVWLKSKVFSEWFVCYLSFCTLVDKCHLWLHWSLPKPNFFFFERCSCREPGQSFSTILSHLQPLRNLSYPIASFWVARDERELWKKPNLFEVKSMHTLYDFTAWCSEIGSLMSLDACNSGASSDVREPISLHQAVQVRLSSLHQAVQVRLSQRDQWEREKSQK